MNVYNYADILIEGVFRAIECRLAQMNVFSHYCSTFSANDCLFSLNEIQKVYNFFIYTNVFAAFFVYMVIIETQKAKQYTENLSAKLQNSNQNSTFSWFSLIGL